MINVLELLYSLKGSYSGVFVALWSACVLVTAIGVSVQKKPWSRYFETLAYWILALLMVAFAAYRPIGIARDDLAYLEIYNGVCPTLACGQWLQGLRDWGWYSLVGLLKSLVADPKVMLWIGAAGLLVKFGVIYRLAKEPLLALMLFTGLFYEVLDLTAWRVALASTVFMIGFWLLAEGRTRLGWVVTLASGLFHKQAFSAALVLPGLVLRHRYYWLIVLVTLPIAMMLIGWYPDIPAIVQRYGGDVISSLAVQQGLDAYIGKKAASGYLDWRIAPIVYYPLLALSVWLARDVFTQNNRLYAYTSISVVWAAWSLWGFASLPDVQVRFFDFMILPVVFLAGACRFDWWRLSVVVAVSGIYVVKYNVLHPLLTGGWAS